MPIMYGKDSKGKCWVRWGHKGKKYYYRESSLQSKAAAEEKAHKQAVAIYASGWREHTG